MERVIDLRHDILTLFILNNQLLRLKINKYYNALCANYIKEINIIIRSNQRYFFKGRLRH